MRRLLIGFLFAALSPVAHAGDWPQWLGPNRDGISTEIVKPWMKAPKVLWRADVGEGHSSPIVAKGLVFLHDRVPGKDAERLSAWNAISGKLMGRVQYERSSFSSPFGAGPRATPVVAQERIVSFGVTGRLAAFPLGYEVNGSIIGDAAFAADTLVDFNAANLTFGVSASPLIEENLIVVPVGGKGAGVVAYDARTGKVAWKSLDDEASYASPIAVGTGTNRQIVVLTKQGLASLAPKDGAVYWKYPFKDFLNESSTTPILVDDLLIASSVTLGSVALRLTEKNGKPAVEKVWQRAELSCYFSTPVPVGKEHVYMINGVLGLKPSIVLRCVEIKTGKTIWQKSNIGKYHAALLRTGDGKLLMLDDSGHLTLFQPNAKEYQELARSKVCGETWAHPALANVRLYLRDNKELLCLEFEE